jgi:hypothetical protein
MKNLLSQITFGELIQGIVTVLVLGVTLALVLLGRPVPDQLWGVTLLIVGFFFGDKVGVARSQAAAVRMDAKK